MPHVHTSGHVYIDGARAVFVANAKMRKVLAARRLLESYGYRVIKPTTVHPDLADAKVTDDAA